MKKVLLIIIMFVLTISQLYAEERMKCPEDLSILAKMKCKANNLKPNKFLKGTLEYQKKAFEKKDKADQ